MAQNKKKKNTKTKQGINQDSALLKKLPGLLAICEFILIPALIVAPPKAELLPNQSSALDAYAPELVGTVEIAAITDIPPPVLPPPKQIIQVTVTAYSSTEDQTDSTPFHTANGKHVEDGIAAANFLPLGTNLRIPEVFGDKTFTVEDRMHERFDRHIDIWMPSHQAAQEFGIRYLTVEIL